jgi:hypothetical protein
MLNRVKAVVRESTMTAETASRPLKQVKGQEPSLNGAPFPCDPKERRETPRQRYPAHMLIERV